MALPRPRGDRRRAKQKHNCRKPKASNTSPGAGAGNPGAGLGLELRQEQLEHGPVSF
jgi:hypothetical protein